MYIALTLVFMAVYSFLYFLDGINAFRNTFSVKREKMLQISKTIRCQYKNILILVWLFAKFTAQTMYLSLCQWLNSSLVKVSNSDYILRYTVGGVIYTIRLHTRKGPRKLVQALDDSDNDITDIIQSYAGPLEDFHNQRVYPETIGTTAVTIHLSSGDELHFSSGESLALS